MKSILIIWVLSNGNGWVIEQHIPVDACSTAEVAMPQAHYYADPHHPDMRAAVCYDLPQPKDPGGPSVGSSWALPPSATQPK